MRLDSLVIALRGRRTARGAGGWCESAAQDRVFVADLAVLAVDVEFAAFAADDLSCSLDCLVLGAQHVVGLLMAWLGDLPYADRPCCDPLSGLDAGERPGVFEVIGSRFSDGGGA
jgi:hypothetical protein